jgi:HSP20 family protein
MLNTPFTNVFERMLALSRTLDQAHGSEGAPTWRNRAQLWLPVVDVYETDSAFVIEADLPGVHLENVDISLEQNTLTLTGTRAPTLQTPTQGELRVYTAERVSGDFARSIRLPEYVDGDKMEAHYTNGVLTITVPKAASARPRKIAIKGASGAKQLNA